MRKARVAEACPTCGRPLGSVWDFPAVYVRTVEILPVPEVIDSLSEEAAKFRLAQQESGREVALLDGINRTPEIAVAAKKLTGYFRRLRVLQGQEVAPARLLPRLKRHPLFRRSVLVATTDLCAALDDGKAEGDTRVCHLGIYGAGPNLGSVGGPTLMRLGLLATIRYEGRLLTGVKPKAVSGEGGNP